MWAKSASADISVTGSACDAWDVAVEGVATVTEIGPVLAKSGMAVVVEGVATAVGAGLVLAKPGVSVEL